MIVLPSIKVHVSLMIRASCPNDRSAQSYCIPRFEVDSWRLERDVGDQEARSLNVRDDSSVNSIVMDRIIGYERIKPSAFSRRLERRFPQVQHFVVEAHCHKRKLAGERSMLERVEVMPSRRCDLKSAVERAAVDQPSICQGGIKITQFLT